MPLVLLLVETMMVILMVTTMTMVVPDRRRFRNRSRAEPARVRR
jgi:hypothetical protein